MNKLEFQGLDLTRFIKTEKKKRILSISKKGSITFYSELLEALKLKEGDFVSFDHEKGKPSAWYLITDQRGICELKKSAGKNPALAVYMKELGQFIAEQTGHTRFAVSDQPASEDLKGTFLLIPQGTKAS